jgi:hypothetical protein
MVLEIKRGINFMTGWDAGKGVIEKRDRNVSQIPSYSFCECETFQVKPLFGFPVNLGFPVNHKYD